MWLQVRVDRRLCLSQIAAQRHKRGVQHRQNALSASTLLTTLPPNRIDASLGDDRNHRDPATGSAHHQSRSAFNSRPPKRIAERYVQKSVCLKSALIAALSVPSATRRFALATSGMTTTETAATAMPGMLRSGFSWARQSQARIEGYVNSERDET